MPCKKLFDDGLEYCGNGVAEIGSDKTNTLNSGTRGKSICPTGVKNRPKTDRLKRVADMEKGGSSVASCSPAKIVYENVLLASDPATLEQLKDLSATHKAVENSLNENNHLTVAIAREMSGGSTLHLVQAATLFRKAAGVYDYLEQVVLVRLIRAKGTTPETTPHISSIMSLVCLADAQAASARKAKEKGSTTSLLAKLHHGITLLLVEAIDTLRNTSKESTDISSRLLDYILSCKTLHELRYYKYTAEGLKDDGEIGVAIGVLRLALWSAKKDVPKEESWRSVFKQVTDDLTVILRKYEHENEFVWYEKVPCNNDLPLPQGVKIVSIIPYEPQKWEIPLVFKYSLRPELSSHFDRHTF
ncbi:hypothetical protein ACS0TY_009597 [Phlomoides rotata]